MHKLFYVWLSNWWFTCHADVWRCVVCPADAKIRELIGALDMRKNEAIERTFKGVAKNFM